MKAQKIIGVDPGPTKSGIVVFDTSAWEFVLRDIRENEETLEILASPSIASDHIFCVEMIEARGYTVSQPTFETAFWVGRYYQAFGGEKHRYYRRMLKMHYTGMHNTKDSHIRQVLIDRYGGKGTKKNPGFFYGFRDDMWQAAAVALYHYETTIRPVFPKLER